MYSRHLFLNRGLCSFNRKAKFSYVACVDGHCQQLSRIFQHSSRYFAPFQVAKLVSEEFFLQGDLEIEEFKEQPAVRHIEQI